MRRRRPHSLLLVCLVLWITGCTTWNPIMVNDVSKHGKIRVTRMGGEREVLTEPRVVADTIKGKAGYVQRSIPVDDVDSVESRSTNVLGTVTIAAVLVMGVLYALDTELPDLGKATKRVVEQAMAGHVLATAQLVGTYARR